MDPKISIIIPIHNSEKYLQDCLDSVVNQSLKEIEIICVVNGSTDSSIDIVKKYKKKDERIILIELEIADLGTARNNGVKHAFGEYLMFVDSDDWIRLEACAKLYNVAKENDLDLLQAKYSHVPKMLFKHFYCRKELLNKKISGLEFWRQNQNISLVNWNKLYKRQFFIENELFNAEGYYYEDNLTSMKSFVSAKTFMIINYNFYFYRRVASSNFNRPINPKHIESSFIEMHQFSNFLKDYKLETEPCIVQFYFKDLFIQHSLYNRKNLSTIKKKAKELNPDFLKYAPIKVRLSYHFLFIASFIYPLWRKRATPKFLIYKNLF